MGRAKKFPDEVMARAVRIALEGERPIAHVAHEVEIGLHDIDSTVTKIYRDQNTPRFALRVLVPKAVSAKSFGRPRAFRVVTSTKRTRCLLALPPRACRLRVGSHPSSQARASRLGFALLGQAYHRRCAPHSVARMHAESLRWAQALVWAFKSHTRVTERARSAI